MMVLWMTKDAFWAAVLGVVIIALFVGYNASRSFKRHKIVKRKDSDSPSKWT